MLSCLCLFKNIWMLLLALLLPFSRYLLIIGFGFFSVICTAIVVIFLSTSVLLYSVSKHRALQHVHKLVEEKVLISSQGSDKRENKIAPTTPLELEVVNVDGVPSNYSTTTSAPDLLSESKCQDQLWSSENSEVDYHCLDFSDGSISDEESLIEIELPGGHYVDHDHQKDHESKNNYCSLQQKKKELSAEALFNQQCLMEFFSEFNEVIEEENFIEIDISMGSIKYSRFGIKA